MIIRIVASNLLDGKVDNVSGESEVKRAAKNLLYLLNALTTINTALHANRFPPLYESGIRYQREEETEDWLSLPDLFSLGYGDCEDLACARAAELRRRRKRAFPYLSWRQKPDGSWLYHVMVAREPPTQDEYIPGSLTDSRILYPLNRSYVIEDPSTVLGMRGTYWPGIDTMSVAGGALQRH